MTEQEFNHFLTSALDELWEKQEKLESEHGFGTFSRWFYDQATEMLELFDENDKKVVIAEVINIGSFASNSNTWKWAWSNESVLPNLRKKSETLKTLGAITGLGLFTDESAIAIENEDMAWEIAAMSVRQLGAKGIYRAPSSSKLLSSFLALTSITRVQ